MKGSTGLFELLIILTLMIGSIPGIVFLQNAITKSNITYLEDKTVNSDIFEYFEDTGLDNYLTTSQMLSTYGDRKLTLTIADMVYYPSIVDKYSPVPYSRVSNETFNTGNYQGVVFDYRTRDNWEQVQQWCSFKTDKAIKFVNANSSTNPLKTYSQVSIEPIRMIENIDSMGIPTYHDYYTAGIGVPYAFYNDSNKNYPENFPIIHDQFESTKDLYVFNETSNFYYWRWFLLN